MDQRTCAWIALHAAEFLQQKNKVSQLAGLLEHHMLEAYMGDWIPDIADAKRGGSR